MKNHKLLAAVVVAFTVAGVFAQEVGALTVDQREARERERIRQTRVDEQARFAAQEAQCYQRFAVSDCLLEIRRSRRDLMADLRRQDLSINDAQRKRRAAQQLLQSDEKASRAP